MSDPFLLSPETYGRMLRSIKKTESRTSEEPTPTQARRNPKKAVYLIQLTTMTSANNPKIWNAIQVYLDTDGLPVASANTIVFDVDNPVFTVVDSSAGEVLEIARKYRPSGGGSYWLALKSAGGSDLTWIKTDADETDGTGTGTVYLFRGSTSPVQEDAADKVVTWNALDVAGKGTIKGGNWFACTENAGIFYPINIPVVL